MLQGDRKFDVWTIYKLRHTNEKGKECIKEKMSRAHHKLQEAGEELERGQREYGEGGGHDTEIADGRDQRVEVGKETWSLSTAKKAGDGGFHACSRFATPSCPLLDACQSGM